MTHLICVGLNHASAPVELLEQLTDRPGAGPSLPADLAEYITLSTCNRVEFYAACQDPNGAAKLLLDFLSHNHDLARETLEKHIYTPTDQDAVKHLMRVAAGLDSQVVGEPQILGQVIEAHEMAVSAKTAGPILSALFRAAIHAGKRARSETGISASAASISSVAVQLAKRLFGDLGNCQVLLVGAGEMSELAAKVLVKEGVSGIHICSRTYQRAYELATRWGGQAFTLDQLSDQLTQVDIVISSTSAPGFIINHDDVAMAMQARNGRPLFLIDIAVPRDIDPSSADLACVHLHNIDDLRTIIDQNLGARRSEVIAVEAIVEQEAGEFWRWFQSLAVAPTIADLRRRLDAVRQAELNRLLGKLGDIPQEQRAAITEFSARLMNKLLHEPTVRLKDEAANGNGIAHITAIRHLFGLERSDR